MDTKSKSARKIRSADSGRAQSEARSNAKQIVRTERVVVKIAHPLFSTARRLDRMTLNIRYDLNRGDYVAYPLGSAIEPMYVPAYCNWVEFTGADRESLSEVARHKWTDSDVEHMEAAVNRAILSVGWKDFLPKARYLKNRLSHLRQATVSMGVALGDYVPSFEGHRAIVSEESLLRNFVEKSFSNGGWFGDLDEIIADCDYATSRLALLEKKSGRDADVALAALLREIIIIAIAAGMKTALPSNSIGEQLSKSTPLSATALELCRLVSIKGMLCLNGPSKGRSNSNQRQRETQLLAYGAKSEASLVKRLRGMIREELNGGPIVSQCTALVIDERQATSGSPVNIGFDHKKKSWKIEQH